MGWSCKISVIIQYPQFWEYKTEDCDTGTYGAVLGLPNEQLGSCGNPSMPGCSIIAAPAESPAGIPFAALDEGVQFDGDTSEIQTPDGVETAIDQVAAIQVGDRIIFARLLLLKMLDGWNIGLGAELANPPNETEEFVNLDGEMEGDNARVEFESELFRVRLVVAN